MSDGLAFRAGHGLAEQSRPCHNDCCRNAVLDQNLRPTKNLSRWLQADDTVLYTNALFLWLQLLLLKPLQPVLASHSAEMARRMRQLAWITAATYFLFCWPCLA